jgi:hypothetical protein
MGIRYRLLRTGVALLVALGFVALGGTWAWAQQEESNPAAQQGGSCPGAERIGTIGPDKGDLIVQPFEVRGDKFRLTYKTTDLDERGEPFLDVSVLDEDKDEVGGRVIRDQGTEKEIVNKGPGKFSLEIVAQDLRYEITIEDCTGNDQSAANDQYRGNTGVTDTNPGFAENPGPGDSPGSGSDPGLRTDAAQNTDSPQGVIAGTIPNRILPDTGGTPLFGLAGIALACVVVLNVAVLRRAIRRP